MIVRLTDSQWRYLQRFDLSDDLRTTLDAGAYHHHATETGAVRRHAQVVAIPYIAWALLRQELVARAFTARGARDRNEPSTLTAIVQLVQTAINVRDRHPALRGAAAMRRQIELIPAWQQLDGGYCPRPNGGHFVVLEPHTERPKRLGVEVTTWRSREPSPGDDWLCQEHVHLGFRAHAFDALGWRPDVDGAGVDQ